MAPPRACTQQLSSVAPCDRRYATLESIVTEEVTFVDGGLGYKLGRSEDALVLKVRHEGIPMLSSKRPRFTVSSSARRRMTMSPFSR